MILFRCLYPTSAQLINGLSLVLFKTRRYSSIESPYTPPEAINDGIADRPAAAEKVFFHEFSAGRIHTCSVNFIVHCEIIFSP